MSGMSGQVANNVGNAGGNGGTSGSDATGDENSKLAATFQQIAAEQMVTTEISAHGSSAIHTAEQGPHA